MGKRKVTRTNETLPMFDGSRFVRHRRFFPWGVSLAGAIRTELLERFGTPRAKRCKDLVEAYRKDTGRRYMRKCGRLTLRDEFGRPEDHCREHEHPVAIKRLAEMEPLK